MSTYLIPFIILFGIVIASATQTEVAHHLTADIGYTLTYFPFFLTHTTFALVCPLHLAFLALTRPTPLHEYIDGLRVVITNQLGETDETPWTDIARRWTMRVVGLTLLVSVPALCWFVSIWLTTSLATTTIYASSSFYAYFFSMLLLRQPLSKITVGSIALAFGGVVVIALAGVTGDGEAPNPVLGDIVMMCGELDVT